MPTRTTPDFSIRGRNPISRSAKDRPARATDILESVVASTYDDIVALACDVCDTPISLVSLVDSEGLWFKAHCGLDLEQTDRELPFCAHALAAPDDEELLEIRDAAADNRFAENPLVTSGPKLRFYAGARLRDLNGKALGTLCVLDLRPRRLNEKQRRALKALARQVMALYENRRLTAELAKALQAAEKLSRDYDQLAHVDELTGVPNLRGLNRAFERLCDGEPRPKMAIAAIDIDGFKAFNDRHGHPAGDEALRAVARDLQAELDLLPVSEEAAGRPSLHEPDRRVEKRRDSEDASALERRQSFDRRFKPNLAARIGGEEFLAVLDNSSEDAAAAFGERLRQRVEQNASQASPLTISVGVAQAYSPCENLDELREEADQALYEAKRSGRNTLVRASALRPLAKCGNTID